MLIIRGFCIAFSMYSKIPMPHVEWDKPSMKLAICFLPLVGAVVGGVQLLWLYLGKLLNIQPFLYACIAVVIPIVLTGGIHFDGFIDTNDGLCSYGDKQKKLNILDDPHVGAFGVLQCVVYIVLQLGLFNELYVQQGAVVAVSIGYVLSRSIGGLSLVIMRCAKDNGLARTFVDNSQKIVVRVVTLLWMIVCVVGLFLIGNTNLSTVGLVLAGQLLLYVYWRRICHKQFGGVSGDLAGYFVQLSELVTLAAVVVSHWIS